MLIVKNGYTQIFSKGLHVHWPLLKNCVWILGLQSKASTPESDASTGESQLLESPETMSSNGTKKKTF